MQVNRKELKAALAAAGKVTSIRPGIPALTGVKMSTAGGALFLECTDLEASWSGALARKGGGDRFEVLAPRKMLAAAVKDGPELIELESDGVVLRAGASRIRLLPLEDYPAAPGPEAPAVATFKAADLVELLGTVAPAASRDEARPVLTGVFLEIGGEIRAASDAKDGQAVPRVRPGYVAATATDSYRLHHHQVAVAQDGAELSAIVPERILRGLLGILGRKPAGRVLLRADASAVTFELTGDGSDGTATVRARIIEGEFPNYRQLLPDPGADVLRFSPSLAACVKAAEPFCKDTAPVRLAWSGSVLELSASSPDLGSFVETVDVEPVGSVEPVTVAFNPFYLLGAVAAVGGAGVLEIRDGLKPAMVRRGGGAEDPVALVMPVRLPAEVPAPEPVKPAEPVAEIHEPSAAERDAGAEVQEPEPVEPIPPAPAPWVEHGPVEDPDVVEPEPVEPDPCPYCGGDHDRITREDCPEWVRRQELERSAEAAAEPWAVLAEVGTVGSVRIRVVVGPDGAPWVDVRRFTTSRRYSGPTRKGLAIGRADAELIGSALLNAAAAAAELG